MQTSAFDLPKVLLCATPSGVTSAVAVRRAIYKDNVAPGDNDVPCPCCNRQPVSHSCRRCQRRFCFRCSQPGYHSCSEQRVIEDAVASGPNQRQSSDDAAADREQAGVHEAMTHPSLLDILGIINQESLNVWVPTPNQQRRKCALTSCTNYAISFCVACDKWVCSFHLDRKRHGCDFTVVPQRSLSTQARCGPEIITPDDTLMQDDPRTLIDLITKKDAYTASATSKHIGSLPLCQQSNDDRHGTGKATCMLHNCNQFHGCDALVPVPTQESSTTAMKVGVELPPKQLPPASRCEECNRFIQPPSQCNACRKILCLVCLRGIHHCVLGVNELLSSPFSEDDVHQKIVQERNLAIWVHMILKHSSNERARSLCVPLLRSRDRLSRTPDQISSRGTTMHDSHAEGWHPDGQYECSSREPSAT